MLYVKIITFGISPAISDVTNTEIFLCQCLKHILLNHSALNIFCFCISIKNIFYAAELNINNCI